MSGLYVPPILRHPGVRFVGMEDRDGHTTLLFSTPEESNATGFVSVTLMVKGPVTYVYSVWDASTRTITHYSGRHGDPMLDKGEIMSPAPPKRPNGRPLGGES
jgi:hypothetical protein